MKHLIRAIALALTSTVLLAFTAKANDTIIEYQAEIYKLQESADQARSLKQLLAHSTLLHAPVVRALADKPAAIEIGDEQALLLLEVNSNLTSNLFSADLSVQHKRNGQWQKASMATPKASLGGTIVARGQFAGSHLLIKVNADRYIEGQ